MATLGVLTVVGVIGLGAVIFEATVMRSPGAGLSPLGILNEVVGVAFQGLLQKLFGP